MSQQGHIWQALRYSLHIVYRGSPSMHAVFVGSWWLLRRYISTEKSSVHAGTNMLELKCSAGKKLIGTQTSRGAYSLHICFSPNYRICFWWAHCQRKDDVDMFLARTILVWEGRVFDSMLELETMQFTWVISGQQIWYEYLAKNEWQRPRSQDISWLSLEKIAETKMEPCIESWSLVRSWTKVKKQYLE